MSEVLIVIHLLIVLALVGVVLIQKSEGGGLGIGGGGGFMTSRGAANALTRATAILAGLFFLTSIVLTVIASKGRQSSILSNVPSAPAAAPGAAPSGSVLDQLQRPAAPAVPQAPVSR